MNYIKKLEQERLELLGRLREAEGRLDELKEHLALPKFKGDGNDYIQLADLWRWIGYLQEPLL